MLLLFSISFYNDLSLLNSIFLWETFTHFAKFIGCLVKLATGMSSVALEICLTRL